MKNRIKRALAMLLIAVLLITTAPLTGFDGLFASKASAAYAVGDHIQYGNYPQSKVTDESTLALLESKSKNWISYGYYSGSGESDDGKMEPSDYMFYADIDVDGDGLRDYRAVRIDKYRPYCTGYASSDSSTYQDDNGYTTGNTYYFKFEPISWRILDPDDGLVMTEKIMDSQAYNNFILSSGTVPEDEYTTCWSDADKTYYANDYYNSSIRQWLNNDFYNTAFTSSQANNIRKDVTLNNDCYDSSSLEYNSQVSKDKIFFLSYEEVRISAYGFNSKAWTDDTARQAQGTDYAKSQGLWANTDSSYDGNNSFWRLRSPYDISDCACGVSYDGDSSCGIDVSVTGGGVRPACRLSNLKSDISKSAIDNNIGFGGSSGEHTDCANGRHKAHTENDGILPTCTEPGLTATVRCLVCRKVVSKQKEIPALGHEEITEFKAATLTSDGKRETVCTVCGETISSVKIAKIKTVVLLNQKFTYSGKAILPNVLVTDQNGKSLKKGIDYTVAYRNNKLPGQASAVITFKGDYSGSKTLNFNILPGATAKISVKQTANKIVATWSKVTGATGYKVYLYRGKKLVKTLDSTKTSVTFKKLSSGTNYTVIVKAYIKIRNSTLVSDVSIKLNTATKPIAPSITVKDGKKQAKVSFKKVTGATNYTVYYSLKKNGGFKKVSTAKNSCVIKNLKPGKTYYFKVIANKKVGNSVIKSSYSKTVSVKIKK